MVVGGGCLKCDTIVQPALSSIVKCTGKVTHVGKMGNLYKMFCYDSSRKGAILEIDECGKNYIEM
jgi:hypothetical protein